MVLQQAQLITALESFMFRVPAHPSIEPVRWPGLRGHQTWVPAPIANMLGVSHPGQDVPDASIDGAFGAFHDRGLSFGWLIGPHSPAGLGRRVAARGMGVAAQFAGLALTDLAYPIPRRGGSRVREIGRQDRPRFAALYGEVFGLSSAAVSFMSDFFFFGPHLRARNYFAYADDSDEPAGVATAVHDPESPILVLGGAGVLHTHRGRGLYHALLQRRLTDARAEGRQAAVIQAMRGTSAPICRSVGFEEICGQELYVWTPD